MSHRCIEAAVLEALRALPAGDARRADAEGCPRCRALLEGYAEFLDDRTVPEGADPRAAEPRLRAAFERALAGNAEAADAPAGPARGAAAPRSPWAAFTGPRLAWAAAAVFAVAAGLYTLPRLDAGGRGAEALRSESAPGTPAARPVLLAPRESGGGLELRWRVAEGADGYRVVFLDEDLARIAASAVGRDTMLVLSSGRLPAGLVAGRSVAWQVEALQGGGVIATSDAAVIRLP